MRTLEEIIEQKKDLYLQELMDLLRIPSVSAEARHAADMGRCAELVKEHMLRLGFKTEIIPTGGHPLVLGEREEDPRLPTVLVYGHYDVQPVEPLDLWDNDPFSPTVVEGNILARGASDDKGQFFAHLKGMEAALAAAGRLPVNIKFIVEGEEEVGSIGVSRFIRENKERLRCNTVLISDSPQQAAGVPAICYGLRGVVALEIRVEGPKRDLHSGTFGGAVANPAEMLARLLATLHDAEARIAVPGFYDDVDPLSKEERESLASLSFDEKAYLADIGSPRAFGEPGYTTPERTWARPTLEVNGIFGGYSGEGSKTIIPSWAGAKLTCRLVPRQDPTRIYEAVCEHLRREVSDAVRLTISSLEHGSPALVVPREGPAVKAATRALARAFGREPVFIREGGSIPLVGTMAESLKVPILLVGFGRPDDRAHSPNEKFALEDFYRGMLTSAYLLEELAAEGAA